MTLPHDASTLWKFLYLICAPFVWLFCRLEIEGRELIPRQGGCIIACNHTRGPDFVILAYASPRQIYYMAKTEIFSWHPLLARFVRSVGTFPVERGKADATAIQTALDITRGGHVLGMFPEGTRSKTGQLTRGKSGVARIAMMAEVPVVPAVVINASAVLPGLFKFRRRPLVTVRFGAPIKMDGNAEEPADIRANTDQMMHSMARLLPPELQGFYREKLTAAPPK